MTTAFIVSSGGTAAPRLSLDLASVGIDVVGTSGTGSGATHSMVPDIIRNAPDLVVCYETHPDDALFASIATLRSVAPRPVVVFTNDPDAEKIDRATRAGIHAYVINGYGLHRLRSIIHVAQARFKHDQLLRGELTEVQHRFSERKLVDRAKGILMRVRNISEDEAYRVLRSAAMQANQRIGQLRMLSQRLVKLYALTCDEGAPGMAPDVTAALCRGSLEQIEGNLAILRRTLSKATFGDVLDLVLLPWAALKAALAAAPSRSRIGEIDTLAEKLLAQSETLTTTLETAGFAAALHVINVSGRQRMLSQRVAKCAIVDALIDSAPLRAQGKDAEQAFGAALAYLRRIPLTSPEIQALLDEAETAWARFGAALGRGDHAARADIAALSETLLATFDRLTDLYERSMQMLME